jgi:hypothetical protein
MQQDTDEDYVWVSPDEKTQVSTFILEILA